MKIAFSKLSKIYFFVLVGVLLFFVFFKFFKSLTFADTSWILEKGEKIGIMPGESFSQVFHVDRDGLSKIRILFGKSYLKSGGEIKISLKDENCEGVIREKTIARRKIQSDGYYDFTFPKLKDSSDKNYCLTIGFFSEKNISKKLFVFLSKNVSPQSIYAVIPKSEKNQERVEKQSLAMRPAYKNANLWQDLSELNQRISQYKPWYFKHYYLSAVILVFLVLGFLLLILLLI